VAEVDLGKHGVIEASAGTGKTYTLVDLTMRLLKERGARLSQILLVTYTEKSAGDIKIRLRKKLEEAVAADPAGGAVYQAALDHFDQAQVSTIHSFCQRILQEYAFENRHDFQPTLADDSELLEACLRELERGVWPKDFEEGLSEILGLSGYSRIKSGGKEWEEIVISAAKDFRPSCDHVVLPAAAGSLTETVHDWNQCLERAWPELRKMARLEGITSAEEHPWWMGFDEMKYHAVHKNAHRTQILRPLLEWLTETTSAGPKAASFAKLISTIKKKSDAFKKHGFVALADKIDKAAVPQLPLKCPGLRETAQRLDEIHRSLDLGELGTRLAADTVRKLHELLPRYKRERGLQSYEDMLTRVNEALDPQRAGGTGLLLEALRDAYRYAIVDEFQDTDRIQWRIFQRIFVAAAPDHRLFVVGDPKQSIYGFRGADLHAYEDAVDELKSKCGAGVIDLKTNWRSAPEMIEALNQLFDKGQWFEGKPPYHRVSGPPPEKQRFLVSPGGDQTGRPALSVVDLTSVLKSAQARKEMARFIAREIERLLGGASGTPLLTHGERGEDGAVVYQPLKESDICVLVWRKQEAEPVMDALRKAGIPFTFYKQTGLWQSDQATHLGYLLKALARPKDSSALRVALLTRVFRVKPEHLAAGEDYLSGHAVIDHIARWRELALERRWSALFQSIQEDTGLLFHEALQDHDGDRRLANWRHILQSLEQEAYERDLDLLGLIQLLKDKRRHSAEEESDLQPIETDQPKVKFMTIHAAKGLEFPIVFLAGGFTNSRKPKYLTYQDDQNRRVIDLRTANADASARADEEKKAEKRRLFYVALTRAIFKLYVPKVAKPKGEAGPLCTLLAVALEKAGIGVGDASHSAMIDPRAPASSPRKRASSKQSPGLVQPITFEGDFVPKLDSDLRNRRIWVRSFSSLHRRVTAAVEEDTSDELQILGEDTDDPAADLQGPSAVQGPVFGEMVHEFIETVDFELVGKAVDPKALLELARETIEEARTKHWSKLPAELVDDQAQVDACRQALAQQAWAALHTPLKEAGGPLWRVPRSDRIHELEFLFPIRESDSPDAASGHSEAFLTGFMDLVFRKDKRFFLVDWKTNLLKEGYTPPDLHSAMKDAGYIDQYSIYLQALRRWFEARLGKGFDFKKQFGGVYYLFLRGMNGQDESSGVFFHWPVPDDFQLKRIMGD
jgi:exodeoxyribonuclease V beta subunit